MYLFSYSELDNAKKFFLEHGFCVIKDIIDNELIEKRIDEIWNHPAYLGNGLINRYNPETWNNSNNWYTDDKGFLDLNCGYSYVDLEYYWKIRFHPKILSTFKYFLEEDILLRLDRTGIMRPTKNIKLNNGYMVDKPEWKTKDGWLHVDYNPFIDYKKFNIQGLLTLTEQTKTSGGFCCVPDFNKNIIDWRKRQQQQEFDFDDIYFFNKDDPVQKDIFRLEAPQGSLILWDGRTAHSNYSNDDNTFRIVDYVNFDRKSSTSKTVIQRHKTLGLELSLCSTDSYFPNNIQDEYKALVNYEQYKNIISTEKEKYGYQLYKDACKLEANGECLKAVKLYRKSYKLCPIIEDI